MLTGSDITLGIERDAVAVAGGFCSSPLYQQVDQKHFELWSYACSDNVLSLRIPQWISNSLPDISAKAHSSKRSLWAPDVAKQISRLFWSYKVRSTLPTCWTERGFILDMWIYIYIYLLFLFSANMLLICFNLYALELAHTKTGHLLPPPARLFNMLSNLSPGTHIFLAEVGNVCLTYQQL